MKRVALPAGLALLWEILARSPVGDPLYSPSLLAIGSAWLELVVGGAIWPHFQASAVRFASGFLAAALTAIPLGLVLGASSRARDLVMPTFDLLRSFPSITLVPVVMVWLGIGDAAKIALVAYACFWPMLLNTVTGVEETSPVLLRAARVMELSRSSLATKLLLPSALPGILTGARLSLAVSVIVLVVSEMLGADRGLGYLILDAERNYLTARMFATVLTLGLLGAAMNALAQRLENRLLAYRGAA